MIGRKGRLRFTLLAALCALSVSELAFIVWFGFGAGGRGGPSAEPSGPTAGVVGGSHGVGEKADSSSAPNASGRAPLVEQAIQDAVSEGLDERRERKRERFMADLMRGVEASAGRELSPEERGALNSANRDYFAALDEGDPDGAPGGRAQARGSANRARIEAVEQIVGSEEEAHQLIAKTMNSFETDASEVDGGTAGREKP
jgi:hypothetical protein